MKKQLGLRIDGKLKDALDERAGRTGKATSSILEEYIAAGLARDNGELIEESSLPQIRVAVREELRKAKDELYQELSADLQKSAKRSDDRLAALIVKAARSAGIGQRLLYSFVGKMVNAEFAAKMYDAAVEHTGKDIARPDETKPTEPRK